MFIQRPGWNQLDQLPDPRHPADRGSRQRLLVGSAVVAGMALTAPWFAAGTLDYFDSNPTIPRLSVLAMTIVVLGAAWGHRARSPELRTPPPHLHWTSLVMATTGAFVAAVVTQLISVDPGAAPDGSESTPPSVLATLSSATLAPLVEELVFRGVIYQTIRTWLVGGQGRWRSAPIGLRSLWPAVAVSSTLFGLAHYEVATPVEIASLIGFGAVMALAYELTGRLWVPILIHATFNLGVDLGGRGLADWFGVVPVVGMVVTAALVGLYTSTRPRSVST